MRPEFTKIFYQFLDREISIEEFFDFVYDNPELQKDISDEKYYNLIGFDWSRKNSDFMLEYFLFDSCIDRGKYWTHRLIGLLNRFEKEEENFESNMESLYDFYGEYLGVRIARKHIGWYCRDRHNAKAMLTQVNAAESCQEQLRAVNDFFEQSQSRKIAA